MIDKAEFTVEENIAYLAHSDLPSIVVEGKDDVIIYRHLDTVVENAMVIAVGGRGQVLEIFQAKQTDNRLQNKTLIFIADQDTFCNTGIPASYQSEILIFTTGYSLENDVFVVFGCQQIVDNHENKDKFEADKDKFIHWYALALQAKINGLNPMPDKRELSTNPFHLLNEYEDFIQLKDNEHYPTNLEQALQSEFPLTIHGKSLLTLFCKHCKAFKTEEGLFQAIAARPGNNINRIFDDVKTAYASQTINQTTAHANTYRG